MMSYESNYKLLNAAQKEAVDTIEGPVLVVAGPGTGKTQLLALRAANILLKTDTAPQNILCLTYTEVGARNMRERLTKLIGQAAYDVRISTYHGFGSDLLRQYGEYFNDFAAEQPVDRLGQDVILQEIFAKLPATNPLWRADIYLRNSLDFISECKRALLSPDDIRTIASDNEHFITKASALVASNIPQFARMNKDVAGHFIGFYEQLRTLNRKKLLPSNIRQLVTICNDELSQAIEFFHETGKTNMLTVWKNKWLAKNADNQWVIAGLRDVSKLRGGADIYEQYLEALKAKQLFDYDDMINRAIHGLETNDELRYSLHEQFLYIMLDEFQDTNLAQLKLVELLTNNPVYDGRANVLAVGDDDQAIYSFQGAELTNMLRFTQMYNGVKIITLTENYRSHADILHASHNIASQIEERLSDSLGTGEKILVAKNASLLDATIVRQSFKSDISQFDYIANRIESLIRQGTPPDEIAVLAPKHKYIEPLIPYLQARNIPIRYDKRENVLDDQHIAELTRMAELVSAISAQQHNTADSIWPSVLSGNYWQLSTSSIWKLSWQSYQNIYSNDDSKHWLPIMLKDETLKPIALFFARLAQIADTESLENMFDYLVGVQSLTINDPSLKDYTSPYYNYYFSDKERNESPQSFLQVLSNITVLRQHLREYRRELDRPLLLHDLLDFIADYRNAGEKLLNTSPYHSANSAVQLMTAYGSKGLEFGVVFVLAVQDDVWGMKARGQNNIISLPPNLSIIRRAGSSKDERKRLFYVAMTRAKHTLYLTSYLQNYAGKTSESLEFMNETEGKSLALPSHAQTIAHDDKDVPAIEAMQHYWTSRHAQGAHDTNLRDLILPRLEGFQLSATHVNTFTDLVYGGPEAFFINTVLKFPKAPTADGQYGNAIHETLESMQYALKRTGELPDIDSAIKMFAEKLKAKRLSENDYTRQYERGALALAEFIPQWWHNFIPEAQTEYSFKHEASFVEDAHLNGNLDQMLVDAETKQIRVVDFKTGKSHAHWTNEVKMHKYKQQLMFYKLLVENSHSFKGYDVTEGMLVFVEPDDHGKINELKINYDREDLSRAKKLIRAIWHRIKTLDLPDTSGYSKDIKGIVAFEDWLINNDL